ncbi:MAG TPA: hypothetical protein VD794_01815 [Flavisolibacter sp.]|nr:hypothetical protein [Flavisolibacter sp.]
MRRSKKVKNMIIEELKAIPIVHHACKKMDISRSTFYRWCDDDPIFAQSCQVALVAGEDSINELAESQLIIKIKQGDQRSIVYWLSHHKAEYKNKEDRIEREIGWSDVMRYMSKYFPDRDQDIKEYEEFREYKRNKET